MKKGLLLSTIVVSLLSSSILYAKDADKKMKKEQNYKSEKKIAKDAIKELLTNFKKNFKPAMKKGGPVGAANFCADKADEITAKVNKDLKDGVSIKRVTLKPRNEKNKADENEAKILTSLKDLQNNKVVLPKMLVQKIDDKHIRIFKPILLKPMCVVCHGTEDKLDKKAYEAIKAKYPNDKATGYKVGDLRGAFVVDIVKK